MINSFLSLFQLIYSICQNLTIHIPSVFTMQIMHQMSKLCILLITRIHINNIRFVLESYPYLLNPAAGMVDRKPISQHIVPGDKNHISFRQFVKIPHGVQRVHVHQATVISGSFGRGPFLYPAEFPHQTAGHLHPRRRSPRSLTCPAGSYSPSGEPGLTLLDLSCP